MKQKNQQHNNSKNMQRRKTKKTRRRKRNRRESDTHTSVLAGKNCGTLHTAKTKTKARATNKRKIKGVVGWRRRT